MRRIKRWTTTIVASFDSMIGQIENHEALINSSIREMQEAGSRARVQLRRVKTDGQGMRKRLLELEETRVLWKERALAVAEEDKQRALECVRRVKRAEREKGALEEQEREHSKIEKQLTDDLAQMEERLQKLKQQRNILKTRQYRVDALKAARGEDSHLYSEMDEIVDRWDQKVSQCEFFADIAPHLEDELEVEFSNKEEESDLEAELRELLKDRAEAGLS